MCFLYFDLKQILFQNVAVSSGTGPGDEEKLIAIIGAIPGIKYICLDVANGYSEHFVNFVKHVHSMFPKHTLMVSIII
jgi:GMP reductase